MNRAPQSPTERHMIAFKNRRSYYHGAKVEFSYERYQEFSPFPEVRPFTYHFLRVFAYRLSTLATTALCGAPRREFIDVVACPSPFFLQPTKIAGSNLLPLPLENEVALSTNNSSSDIPRISYLGQICRADEMHSRANRTMIYADSLDSIDKCFFLDRKLRLNFEMWPHQKHKYSFFLCLFSIRDLFCQKRRSLLRRCRCPEELADPTSDIVAVMEMAIASLCFLILPILHSYT